MNENRIRNRLGIGYFFIYAACACYYPFLTLYFESRKLSYGQMGIMFALSSFIGILFQPIWGYVTDKYSTKRSIMMITMLMSGVTAFGFILAGSFYGVILATISFMIFLSPISSIADAYTYEIMDKYPTIQFGKIRLVGSISYAILALLMGFVIQQKGVHSTFIVYAILILVSVYCYKNIKVQSRQSRSRINLKNIGQILSNKNFLVFIFSVMILNMALGANGNYLAVLIKKTGGDASNIGTLWFAVAISELPAFFLGNKIVKKYGALNLYIIGIILYGVRFFLDSICSSYMLVIIVQLMQGITFPLYTVACLQYINETVDGKVRTSAITLYAALGGGLGNLIGNIAGGYMLEYVTVFLLFRILFFLSIVGVLAVLLLKSMEQKDKGITM